MPPSFFERCSRTTVPHPRHNIIKLESNPPYKDVIKELSDKIPSHYVPHEILEKWGRTRLAKYLINKLPTKQNSRSGELGEILATEYINGGGLPFEVPIKRLRWKDTREWPMRGEDVLAFNFKATKLGLLKVEAKSYKQLTDKVVSQARKALDNNSGLPLPYTLGFIMERLYESKQDAKADRIEEYVSGKLPAESQIAHLMFTFSQNDPVHAFMTDTQEKKKKAIKQHYVALLVAEHQEIIREAYKKAAHG
jgi:hypothetical protein